MNTPPVISPNQPVSPDGEKPVSPETQECGCLKPGCVPCFQELERIRAERNAPPVAPPVEIPAEVVAEMKMLDAIAYWNAEECRVASMLLGRHCKALIRAVEERDNLRQHIRDHSLGVVWVEGTAMQQRIAELTEERDELRESRKRLYDSGSEKIAALGQRIAELEKQLADQGWVLERAGKRVKELEGALEQLFLSCANLRLRCSTAAPAIKLFDDWADNTAAMRVAESVIRSSDKALKGGGE